VVEGHRVCVLADSLWVMVVINLKTVVSIL